MAKILVDGVITDAEEGFEEQAALDAANAAAARTLPDLSPRQLDLMLYQIGMTWSQVQAQIDAIADPDERYIANSEFNRAIRFRRDHPLVLSLASTFGFSELEMDTMWVAASKIE